jgi:non-lysosomal glucosylceramidase
MGHVTAVKVLFQAHANRSQQQQFACLGYNRPVMGTIYPRASLRWYGMPLGGLGTGYVCWDTTGRFSQCTLFNQVPNASQVPVLNTIPFHLTANGRTWALAMKGDDGQGDLLDLAYFGHFPIADVQFVLEGPISVEIRAFTPFLPGDAITSNTPAIVFEAWLTNISSQSIVTNLAFTPPAAPKPIVEHNSFTADGWQGVSARHPWDKASPKLGNEQIAHEIAVAVDGGIAGAEAGALSASFTATLAPGEKVRTRFVLAWRQPYIRDSWNRAEKLIYADRFSSAQAVAEYAIAHHQAWLSRIIAWQSVLYAREELPALLREALVNSFYASCKNSHWIARWRPDDWFPTEGLFLMNESYATCPISETLPCHYFGSFPMLFFFPELERTTLEGYRHYQLKTGEIPFSFDRGFGARAPNYQTQHNNGIIEYIEMVYRYWLRSGEEDFLREFYPSVVAAQRYVEFLDTDDDGLVNEHPHSLPGEFWPANVGWDNWPQFGTSGYTAMKSLTACEALAAMAESQGDSLMVTRCHTRLARGRARLEKEFWNGSYYRLQIDPAGVSDETCLLAQVTGAWATSVLGLPDPVPAEHLSQAITAIIQHIRGLSTYGLVLAATPAGAPVYSNQSLHCDFPRDVWPLFNFVYSATCQYYDAERDTGLATAMQVLETLFHAANAMPWGWPCNINAFDGWIGHGHDYNDPQAIWTLPLALTGQNLQQGVGLGSLVADIIAAARG